MIKKSKQQGQVIGILFGTFLVMSIVNLAINWYQAYIKAKKKCNCQS